MLLLPLLSFWWGVGVDWLFFSLSFFFFLSLFFLFLSSGSVARLNRSWWCNTKSFASKFKLCKSLGTSILLLCGCETWTLLATFGLSRACSATETCMVRAVTRHDSLSKTILQGTLDGGRCRGRRHSNPETCLLYIPTTKKSVIRVVTFLAVFQNNDSCFTDSLPYSYRQNKTMCKCSAYCLFQATNRQSDSLQCTKMLLLCVWSITRI